jgi:hypothetical protein
MNQESFSIIIANDTERERVFAEIYYKNEQWAEISIEGDLPLLELFSPINRKFWEFPLDEALQTLEIAKKKLLG